MIKKNHILILVFLFVSLNSNLFAVDKTDTLKLKDTSKINLPLKQLKIDIDDIIENPDFSNGITGILVQSLETGEIICKKNNNTNFLPASTQKIITTSAALEILGQDYKYSTKFFLDGQTSINGEFKGNIIIKGYGDPTLSNNFYENPNIMFDEFINVLDSLGIKSIKGNIIGDDSYFDNVYYGNGWAWNDMNFAYSAQVSALSFMDNKVDIVIEQGDSIGANTKFNVIPENKYVRIINNVKTVAKQDVVEISALRDAINNIIVLNGNIGFDSTKKEKQVTSVTIDNPTLFLLSILKDRIEKHNIRFRGALLDIDDWNEKPFYYKLKMVKQFDSPPLIKIVEEINKNSNNLLAEILLKTIAKEISGIGSSEKGIEIVKKHLAKNGVSPDNIEYTDGSGLSRLNLISPANQVSILTSIFRSNMKDAFIKSLATPNEEGTLKRRMTQSRAEKNVFAKTGSMENVSAICGYVITRDKEYLAFSIMQNNFTVPGSLARNLQDLILMRLAAFSRKNK
ncbi:MAG: D-alanyl-D-alanine carboxypeptidase/D-alanyl-D-alanine-endopeptidase [Candidatus Kapabacteria bacterium]|nr:D-alanyl-D-alanine carboxypeptidase/D-alanyl-D-alanine-endopeptidase [Candidatus Kapabacteria bacterium]